jgi:hypothetical protein
MRKWQTEHIQKRVLRRVFDKKREAVKKGMGKIM